MAPLVVVTGFMGSGKTAVGARVAALLGCEFLDLDEKIVSREGMPIAEYFARHGEAEFRRREVRALTEVLNRGAANAPATTGLVLALGGGTLESPEAAFMLRERGGVVYLDVDAATAWERAQGPERPLARDRTAFEDLLARRRPSYEGAADWIVPVAGRAADEVAQEIADAVRAAGPAWPTSWGLRLESTGRPSTIIGGPGCLQVLQAKAAAAANRGARVFVITDENVREAWGGEVLDTLGPSAAPADPLVLSPGEQTKTVDNLAACWEWLAAQSARRDDIVLALGGGVIGDLAGFAASTYQRGVGLWQVPTSLLAQVDSSVGGKTAIDLSAGKNLAGAFYQPDLVVIDPRTLATLPEREYVNGLGEVVKHGLLVGEDLFGRLSDEVAGVRAREPRLMSEIIRANVRYKASVVAEDELDVGRRAVLNLGHTTAHALEVTLGYGSLGHGEAVALGLLVSLAVSERVLGLDPAVRQRTRDLLAGLGLPVSVELPPAADLQAAAARDKKVTAGSAGFVGLRTLGDPVWKMALPEGLFLEALEVIRG
jgi:shikimate kinase / 3-dehydroquinate synthase